VQSSFLHYVFYIQNPLPIFYVKFCQFKILFNSVFEKNSPVKHTWILLHVFAHDSTSIAQSQKHVSNKTSILTNISLTNDMLNCLCQNSFQNAVSVYSYNAYIVLHKHHMAMNLKEHSQKWSSNSNKISLCTEWLQKKLQCHYRNTILDTSHCLR
jgi:hypothetical protein